MIERCEQVERCNASTAAVRDDMKSSESRQAAMELCGRQMDALEFLGVV